MGNDTDATPAATDYLGDILATLEDVRGELIAIREQLAELGPVTS